MKPANTCLIVGAGASVPWNYPLGSELNSKLIDLVRQPSESWIWLAPSDKLQQQQNRARILMKDFEEGLQSGKYTSIDSFLDDLKQNPDKETRERYGLGKVLIAAVIRQLENPYLFKPNWYGLLFEHLEHSSTLHVPGTLRIITFNYDRSLEYYVGLFHALEHRLEQDEGWKTLNNRLELVHVYGSVGNLPCPRLKKGEFAPKYGSFFGHDAWEAGHLIKIIEREDSNSQAFVKCQEWISQADHVIILGFGFDDQNCRRLKLAEATKGKHVYTTAFDKKEHHKIMGALPNSEKLELGQPGEGCFHFLLRTQALRLALDGQG